MRSSGKSIQQSYKGALLIGVPIWIACCAFAQDKQIRVACIGNSVTFGLTHTNPSNTSYPRQLQVLLGEKYSVKNFGHSGATLLTKGHRPYIHTPEFHQALAFAPDIAIIELGLNDTDPRNWPNFGDEFIRDYCRLIDTIRKTNSAVDIYITRLTPIFHDHARFLSGTRDWFWQIQQMISQIAKTQKVHLIDYHTSLYARPDIFGDAVHPNEEGAAILARLAYQHITGDFGGLRVPSVFQSGMVLQRESPIRFYGTANAGEEITVTFNRSARATTAAHNGVWQVVFPAMSAGGPYHVTISNNRKKIELNNLLLGDVWLCSGQSNMAFPLKSALGSTEVLQRAQSSGSIRLLKMNVLAETDNTAWDSSTLSKVNRLEYFSGQWVQCDSSHAKEFSAVGYFFGQQLQEQLQVPVGLIQVAVGGSTTESWIDRYTLEHDPVLVNELKNWRKSDFFQPWVRERTDKNLENGANPKQRHPYEPAYNFEAGISGLTNFPIKGVIWYQGESNAHNVELHDHVFPVLVDSWRKKWGYPFPFYYVQLSSINRASWTNFRFHQLELSKKIANSGMAVSSDVGDSLNVHPVRKKEVGERLARLALHYTYKRKNITPCGPLPINAKLAGQEIYITFNYSKGLRTADGLPVRGFSVVDTEGNQMEVVARIEKDQIIISLEANHNVTDVRYAWQPYTTANLVNSDGLPASTFKMHFHK